MASGVSASGQVLTASPLKSQTSQPPKQRLDTGSHEINAVLGGGIVPGSLILLAGEPGIGKSTLLLGMANGLAQSGQILYVSGEESAEQVSLRAGRMGVKAAKLDLATTTNADDVAATIAAGKYDAVIVDSIQTMATASATAAAGTISQITASAQIFLNTAKNARTAVIMTGHVTKAGNVAGPKILEHMVDVVLYLQGERFGHFKMLYGAKNRFGSTYEVGIFAMTDKGMVEVKNPSSAFLMERQVTDGSVVLAALEGSRPMLVEVQALVSPSPFGYPKRTASGFDINRLHLLLAVLARRAGLQLGTYDVYVNIVGGLKVSEPAADLAVCLAIASAAKNKQLGVGAVAFGEVGLSGEIRSVNYPEKRLAEARKLGFKQAFAPSMRGVKGVGNLRDAIKLALGGK